MATEKVRKGGIQWAKPAWIVSVAAQRPWEVETAVYTTMNHEVCTGFTNHTIDEKGENVYFLLLERDDKDVQLEDWLRGLTLLGVKPVIVAETARGYHATTANAFKSKQEIVLALELLSASGLVDDGIYALARIREQRNIHFTNVLRISGKYDHKDIAVRRWLPPPTPWHAHILALYARKCTLEISATRLAHRCPGFVGKPSPAAKAGQEIHKTWEEKMSERGWLVEQDMQYSIGNIRFRAIIDAVKDNGPAIHAIELKSTARSAMSEAAFRQLIAECALAALTYEKPTLGEVQTPDGETWQAAMIGPEEAKRHLLRLLRTSFTAPDCRTCIFNTFCKGWQA